MRRLRLEHRLADHGQRVDGIAPPLGTWMMLLLPHTILTTPIPSLYGATAPGTANVGLLQLAFGLAAARPAEHPACA